MKFKINDVAFLLVGVISVALGYSVIKTLADAPAAAISTSFWWAFGSTLFGGLILGKWLADNWKPKRK